uniref:Uncharacterized protein n=1 Tax=Cucumis melo TaxID=3656 RepID=A0A9I9E6F4_CUCME
MCFYTSLDDLIDDPQGGNHKLPLYTLHSLENIISQRKAELASLQTGKKQMNCVEQWKRTRVGLVRPKKRQMWCTTSWFL